jgi:hypothetical protein
LKKTTRWPTAGDQSSTTEDSPDDAEAPEAVIMEFLAKQEKVESEEAPEALEEVTPASVEALEALEEVKPASEAEEGEVSSSEHEDEAIVAAIAALAEPKLEEEAETAAVQDAEGGGRVGSRDMRLDEWVENTPRHGRRVSEAEYRDLRMEREAGIDTNTKWRHRGVNPDQNPGAPMTFRGQRWRPGSQRFANSGGTDRAWHKGYYIAKKRGEAAAQEYIRRHGPPPKYR